MFDYIKNFFYKDETIQYKHIIVVWIIILGSLYVVRGISAIMLSTFSLTDHSISFFVLALTFGLLCIFSTIIFSDSKIIYFLLFASVLDLFLLVVLGYSIGYHESVSISPIMVLLINIGCMYYLSNEIFGGIHSGGTWKKKIAWKQKKG